MWMGWKMNHRVKKTPRNRAVFGLVSFCLVVVPVVFLVILIFGGGASGFRVWNDLAWLLVLIAGSAVTGVILSMVSIKREENSVLAGVALFIHLMYLGFIIYALGQ